MHICRKLTFATVAFAAVGILAHGEVLNLFVPLPGRLGARRLR